MLFEKVSNIFTANYQTEKPICINQGGSSSGKTWSILQVLLTNALQKKTLTTVVGQDIPNLKGGSLRDMQGIINDSELIRSQILKTNSTDRTIYFRNGSIIEFKAYSDEQDAKNGKRDYLFLNEANGIKYEIAEQLMLRTKIRTYIDYNPSAEFWVQAEIINKLPLEKYRFIKSTYKNNPFCPQTIVEKIESYRETNTYMWKVYGLGEMGTKAPKNPFITAKTDRLFNPNLVYNPLEPIYMAIDINNEPLTCLIAQCSQGKHTVNHGYIRVIDEVKINGAILAQYPHHEKFTIMCLEVKRRYKNSPIFLTGDASGWAGSPLLRGSTANFYLHIAQILNLNPQTQILTPRSNLEHRLSQTLVNSTLASHPNCQINPNTCPELSKEINMAEIDDKGKLIKDRDLNKLDSFDAWRYLLATVLYPHWLRG